MPTTAKTYPLRVHHYEDAAGLERLQRLASERGVSVAALLRQLAREEDARLKRAAKRA